MARKSGSGSYMGEEYKVEDLNQFYLNHKDTVTIKYLQCQRITMMGKNVLIGDAPDYCMDDMVEYIAIRLQQNFKGGGTGQIIVWKSDFKKRKNIK